MTDLVKGHSPETWKAAVKGITAKPTRASQTAREAMRYMPTLCSFLLFQMMTITMELPIMVTRMMRAITNSWATVAIATPSNKREGEVPLERDFTIGSGVVISS